MSAENACAIMNGTLARVQDGARRFAGVSIDSRTLRPRNAFFCLRGERVDGHRFAETAARNSAGTIVVNRERLPRFRRLPVPVIGVDDTVTALGDLAAEFRKRFPTRYIAVTGSVGKTTTKEMIAAVLATKCRVFRSPGNYNNLLGIPLALLERTPSSDAEPLGVLEFGMSSHGEIARLTGMIQPQWGVVTRIGVAHLLQMKSLLQIARAKRELFDHSDPSVTAFLNADDPYQRRWAARWRRPTVRYGIDHAGDVTASDLRSTASGVSFRVNARHDFAIHMAGEYNVANALAAIAVGRSFGVSFRDIADALRRVRPVGERSRILRWNGALIIDDCYNANPTSMAAAIESLKHRTTRSRRIAVLGAMRELGRGERQWHRRAAQGTRGLDLVLTVGPGGLLYQSGLPSEIAHTHVASAAAAAQWATRHLRRGDVVLIKGSHSEGLDVIGQRLREHETTRGRRS
jgi:UDP-N-acetylmuramoyl-tripeptide--D-alanyl-D-alanine ligase